MRKFHNHIKKCITCKIKGRKVHVKKKCCKTIMQIRHGLDIRDIRLDMEIFLYGQTHSWRFTITFRRGVGLCLTHSFSSHQKIESVLDYLCSMWEPLLRYNTNTTCLCFLINDACGDGLLMICQFYNIRLLFYQVRLCI